MMLGYVIAFLIGCICGCTLGVLVMGALVARKFK